jgi:hypothetical protein
VRLLVLYGMFFFLRGRLLVVRFLLWITLGGYGGGIQILVM